MGNQFRKGVDVFSIEWILGGIPSFLGPMDTVDKTKRNRQTMYDGLNTPELSIE